MPKLQKKKYSAELQIAIWHISETLDELMELFISKGFDAEKIIETKSEIRLKQWLAVRLLLHDFYQNESIYYDEFGKPFLKNGVEISISHAGKYAVIAFNTEKKCGIDIEKISNKVEKIKFKFLNNSELGIVDSLDTLTMFWCAKEALYKLYGEKELIFNEQLLLEFSDEPNKLVGFIKTESFYDKYQLQVEKIEDYLLVYTC